MRFRCDVVVEPIAGQQGIAASGDDLTVEQVCKFVADHADPVERRERPELPGKLAAIPLDEPLEVCMGPSRRCWVTRRS